MTVVEIPWIIDEHTHIKHALLTKYIDPWMAIFFAVRVPFAVAVTADEV